MILFFIIIILLIISFLLSVWALRSELKKSVKTEEVTDELAKGRVIFHASSSFEDLDK